LEYAYDDQVHTHNVSVTDSFGYVSTARYNLKYGKVVNTTDINNQPLDYTYDKFGRVATIVGPYQTGSGLETIRFAYHPEAEITAIKLSEKTPTKSITNEARQRAITSFENLQSILWPSKSIVFDTSDFLKERDRGP